ncbi:hypothetical protein FLLO111716_02995 [Flavobacterium longum]|uniref:T9SS type A sorting domain-containing protein n=1 Tax=Flavobacterium longum TaxID=1299340 RepID=UPI0039ED0E02
MVKNYILIACLFVAVVGNAQIINFPDPAFKAKLLTSSSTISPVGYDANGNYIVIDANNDGEIQESEALLVYRMVLDANPGEITDVTGIAYFENLTALAIYDNPLTSLDVSMLTNLKALTATETNTPTILLNDQLEILNCSWGILSTLDISHCPNLKSISCQNNNIEVLDASSLTQLVDLRCSNNQIAVLDISNSPLLQTLECSNNMISELDVSGKSFLNWLYCDGNQITSLDLTGTGRPDQPWVWFFLNAANNNLSTLDISVMSDKYVIADVSNNPNLTSINACNDIEFFDAIWQEPPLPGPSLYFQGTPNLTSVSVYPMNAAYVQDKITLYGYTNVTVSTSCTLGAADPEFKKIALYPNPVKQTLFIEGDFSGKVSVFNMLGQLMMTQVAGANTLDVSALASGNYVLRLEAAHGTTTARFIKE